MLRNLNNDNDGTEVSINDGTKNDSGKENNKTRYRSFKKKARHIYGDQLICLSAILIMAVWRSGWRALTLVTVSTLVSVLVDMICCKMAKKKYNPKDLSTITAGMCIALMMPASISYPLVICGSALAMGVKHIFGGKDNYIFNPTAVALAFLIICYPGNLLLFPKVGETLPAFGEINVVLSSGIESYLMKMGTAQQLSVYDMLLGNFQGPIGTTHTLVILVCAVCLVFRRSISSMVTFSAIGIIIIIASLFPLYDNFANMLSLELIGGYLLFGLLFLANDPQTIPETAFGKYLYGITLGIIIVLFRYFGKVEGSSVFALLAANTISIRADRTAYKLLDNLHKLNVYLRERLSFYERFTQDVKEGREVSEKKLSDTQEIIINPLNYDMPPIDNKVLKINRKKPNLLALTKEKFGTLGEKGVEVRLPAPEKLKKQKVRKDKIKIKSTDIPIIGALIKIISEKVSVYKRKLNEKNAVKPVHHKSQTTEKAETPEMVSTDTDKLVHSDQNVQNVQNVQNEVKSKTAFEEFLKGLKLQEISKLRNLIRGNKGEKQAVENTDSKNKDLDETVANGEAEEIKSDDVDIIDFEELIGMPGVMDADNDGKADNYNDIDNTNAIKANAENETESKTNANETMKEI